MIALFHSVGDALKRCRWMIELARDFNSELRMPPDSIIVDRDSAVGCDERATFGQPQWIDSL